MLPSSPSGSWKCDIFCTVIDNYGDAGVCWRLAHQLSIEHDWQVRLWIDDPAPIALLAPGQNLIDVQRWTDEFADVEPADIVIEAFACPLPQPYLKAMRACPRPPVWINLEYLSAESWVADCHGLPSPQAGLSKYFFFPGFVAGTGGLIREAGFTVPPAPTFKGLLDVSLFCYDNPALPSLLDAWCNSPLPVNCHVCAGLPQRQVETWLGEPFPIGSHLQRGNLLLLACPFLPQTEYDALLAQCHLNFVRGEDSWVRAQWAERPFVWQAYPQKASAHLAKLEAFLALYAPPPAVREFIRAWNGFGTLDWPTLAAQLPQLAAQAPGWASQIAAPGDLATNLVKFCASRL